MPVSGRAPHGSLAARAREFHGPRVRGVAQVPYARTILAIQLAAALLFLGYTLVKKEVRLPFSPEPYYVDVILPDAKGLNPSKDPAAGVAGVVAGKVVEARLEPDGKARVTLRLDPEMRGKVFADASASVRPTSVLQTLMVNIHPGTPGAGQLPDGGVIDAARTDTFVHIDELTSMLDVDTRAQVAVLVAEAQRALRGRAPEVRAMLGELAELTDTAQPLARALAERRRLVTRMVGHVDELFELLGQRGDQLAAAIRAGRRTLAVTGAREPELAAATRELAPALREAGASLASTRALAGPLSAALDELIPASASVGPAARELRELAPHLEGTAELADRLIEEGARPAAQLASGMRGLGRRIANDQTPALEELADLVELLYDYRNGIVQFAENMSALISANRNGGAYVPYVIVDSELHPEGFGLSPDQARRPALGGRINRLGLMLARAFEGSCREGSELACLMRFAVPGLPRRPLLEGGRG